jgi:hypothetical protein
VCKAREGSFTEAFLLQEIVEGTLIKGVRWECRDRRAAAIAAPAIGGEVRAERLARRFAEAALGMRRARCG